MSDFLTNLALRGAGIPVAVQLAPSRSAMLASEPGMFPGIEVTATPAASPPPSTVQPVAQDSADIVQRQPAGMSPAPMASPPAPASATAPVIPTHAKALPSAVPPEAASPLVAEAFPTPSASTRVPELHQPNEITVRDTSRVLAEPERASPPAEFEARGAEKTPVQPRVQVEEPLPQPSTEVPSSRVVPPSKAPIVEAAAPAAPLRTSRVMQARPSVEEPALQEVAQARPRPAILPEPAVAVDSPPAAPPPEAVAQARPVEVRIGRIEVRVNSPAPAPPVFPAAEMSPSHASDGAGFDGYDAIRGYRIPTVW